MCMLRTCENIHGGVGWPKCVGMLDWCKCMGMLGWVGISMSNCTGMPFKVRPGVLSKTLSHIREN